MVDMAKTLGYMVTWTTYGTWLQGDERGYVRDGKICGRNPGLEQRNKEKQTGNTIKLTNKQKNIVRKAIPEEAHKLGQILHSIAVCTNHVHMVVSYISDGIERSVKHYKNASLAALRKDGFVGRVWTRGYDKRYCFDEKSLKNRIDYVERHKR
jgi:REP element-mobilizing transposase RayT